MIHTHNGRKHLLNLIDTPGHVDFAYEVARSLAACDGALLLVDATQGVQAQSMSVFHIARARGLTIIPVLNKVYDFIFTIQELKLTPYWFRLTW